MGRVLNYLMKNDFILQWYGQTCIAINCENGNPYCDILRNWQPILLRNWQPVLQRNWQLTYCDTHFFKYEERHSIPAGSCAIFINYCLYMTKVTQKVGPKRTRLRQSDKNCRYHQMVYLFLTIYYCLTWSEIIHRKPLNHYCDCYIHICRTMSNFPLPEKKNKRKTDTWNNN